IKEVDVLTGEIKATVEHVPIFPATHFVANEDQISRAVATIKEELADVANYCVLMADACGLDLDEIVREKIKRNEEKYPIEKSKGSKRKYTNLK
ncbi:MAG: hypothetical protein HXL51_06890, partial [Solobacterium sp.]|nr:hypothetical protein [Solobacterium sp.]